MSNVLRDTMPMRTGESFPGCSAQNVLLVAAGSRIEETERKPIAIHPVLPIGFSSQRWRWLRTDDRPAFTEGPRRTVLKFPRTAHLRSILGST